MLHLLACDWGGIEIVGHYLVVKVGNGFDEVIDGGLNLGVIVLWWGGTFCVCWRRGRGRVGWKGVEQGVNVYEAAVIKDGVMQHGWRGTKGRGDGVHDGWKVSGVAIHFVNKGESRETIGVGLTPDSLCLRLDGGDGVEQDDGGVDGAQTGVDLEGEVEMTRRVEEEEVVVAPGQIRGGGGYGYAATALLLLVVEGGGSGVDGAHAGEVAGVEEHCL